MHILGATDIGLSGSEIGRYLHECGCPDPILQMTKRHRLYAAMSAKQKLLPPPRKSIVLEGKDERKPEV
jgi:hypothetical protein